MAFVKFRVPRTSQPQDLCGVDWSNPLTSALGGLFDTSKGIELVYNNRASNLTTIKATGRAGLSADFSGTANQQYAHRPGYATTGAMTIFAALEIRALSNYTAILAKQYTTTRYAPYELRLGAGTTGGEFNFVRATETLYNAVKAPSAIIAAAAGKLQTLSVKSDNGLVETWPTASVNGVVTALNAWSSGGTTGNAADNGSAVWIGRRYDGATQLDGRIYYVAVWNRALTDIEIASLSANPWQLFEPEEQLIWVPDTVTTDLTATVYTDSYAAYLIRNAAAIDITATYNLNASSVIDLATAFNIQEAVSQDLILSFNIQNTVPTDLSIGYYLSGVAQCDVTSGYNLRGVISTDISPAYFIQNAGAVQADLSAAYSVRGIAQIDITPIFQLHGSTQCNFLSNYIILGVAQADFSASYDVTGSVSAIQSDLSASYGIGISNSNGPSTNEIVSAILLQLNPANIANAVWKQNEAPV